METVYIKVPVEKWMKSNPEEKRYNVVFPTGDIFSVYYDNNFGLHDEFTDCSGITHVLVEKSLPTDEEIKGYFKRSDYSYDSYHGNIEGAKFLRDKILGL